MHKTFIPLGTAIFFVFNSFLFSQVTTFDTTGTMKESRQDAAGVVLQDGRVLVCGGIPGSGNAGAGNARSSAEIYDPATRMWSYTTGSMNAPRTNTQATLLNNGIVLITGGHSSSYSGPTYYNSAELFDPSTGTFTMLSSNMGVTRTRHSAVKLNNGKVLILGGHNSSNQLSSALLFDPNTNTFTSTGSMNAVRYGGQTATLLQSGKVLVVGGNPSVSYAELYDPSTGTFSVTGDLNYPRSGQTATLLDDGKVLITGGNNGTQFYNTAEIYDPSTGTFNLVQDTMSTPRSTHTATKLSDGRVLIVGGRDGTPGSSLTSAEIFDPISKTFSSAGSLNEGRFEHLAFGLNNNKVLITGGAYDVSPNGSIAIASAELFNYNYVPTSIENTKNKKLSYLLFQNYPNPFNPTTIIKYEIPKTSLVTLKIYDILGRVVKTLVNEKESIGSYKVEFNASRLASGIYFYRIQAGDYVQTKKMILLK